MQTRDPTEGSHLLSVESRPNQIRARLVPLILRFPFFKPNVTTRFQFNHHSLDVLVANIVNFLFECIIGLLKLREHSFLVLNQRLDPASLALYVCLKLLCGHLVKRVGPEVQVGPIRKHRFEVCLVRKRDVLSFFDLPIDLL